MDASSTEHTGQLYHSDTGANKVCIVLSSVYDDSCPPLFQEEVEQDLETVRATLNNHSLIDIRMPVGASCQFCIKQIRQSIDAHRQLMRQDVGHVECHIVLNTHGVPGASDLRLDSILYLVELLSNLNVSITQISGLQCDGMAPSEARRQETTNLSENFIRASKRKDANLHILQQKLLELPLTRRQHFTIRGFEYAYLPLDSTEEIKRLLAGEGGSGLAEVNIEPHSFPPEYFRQILEYSTRLQRHHKDLPPPAYQELTNFLGRVQHDMKQRISNILQYSDDTEIAEDSPLFPLYSAVISFASQFTQATNAKHFDAWYKHWVKDHKVYSETRTQVLVAYAQMSLS